MSATMVGRWRKISSQKNEMGPKYKLFKISTLEFFFWKCYFGHTNFLYRFIIFFISFYYIFSIIFHIALILRNSTLSTLKTIFSRNIAKILFDFTNFPAKMFLFGVRNNICTASFLDAQEPHSWSALKANFCTFLYISVRKYLFARDVVRFYLLGIGWEEAE